MERAQQNQSKNIALLEYNFEKGDEIATYIGTTLKEYLNRKLNPNESLEIEAKLGIVIPSQEIDIKDPFYTLWSIPNGLILPDQKLSHNGKTLYYFNPGVTKEKFDLLIKIFGRECEKREAQIPEGRDEATIERYKQEYMIKDHGSRYTVDRVFEDGIRQTYKDEKVIEWLKKEKLKNINYWNHGRDFRISISIEEKWKESQSFKIINTRHKTRRTFQFKWMQFDFTETVEEDDDGRKSDPKYEIELEIWNTKFFNQPDYLIYSKLATRFVQNIYSLTNALSSGEEIFFDTTCQPDFDQAYKEAYKTEVMPIVGDYLGTKAFSDKMT